MYIEFLLFVLCFTDVSTSWQCYAIPCEHKAKALVFIVRSYRVDRCPTWGIRNALPPSLGWADDRIRMPPQVFHSICPPKKALSKCRLEEKSLHWKKLRMNMQYGGGNCDDVNHSVVSMKQLKNAFQQKCRNVESFLTWTGFIEQGSRWMVNPFQPIWVWARLDWCAHYFCIFICPCLCVCPAGRRWFNPSQPIWVWARLDWRRQVGETQDTIVYKVEVGEPDSLGRHRIALRIAHQLSTSGETQDCPPQLRETQGACWRPWADQTATVVASKTNTHIQSFFPNQA